LQAVYERGKATPAPADVWQNGDHHERFGEIVAGLFVLRFIVELRSRLVVDSRRQGRSRTLDQPGRERYQKSPKVLIQVGEGGGGDCSRALGFPLEIVPLRNPFLVKIGDMLAVRVLFQGKPLPEANLGWQSPGDGELARGTVRTDGKGETLIPIARADLMTVRLTHMTRPKAKDYEWESFWTTLTFRIPAAVAR
jgi:hypothetical protein